MLATLAEGAISRKFGANPASGGRLMVTVQTLAVTFEQVRALHLPTRPHKREAVADRKWPHSFACELDAIPPDHLRHLVENAINRHLPQHQLEVLKAAEESERDIITRLVGKIARKRLR
jgi:hypothetical protein